ncbi:MAG: hypothetical protein A3B38_04285 [Candidatus Levybacteria bacterium RIFCSPLOWO2_01_FULL_36_13]|nr:MAG: hypothetical protein A2684_01210 [Candidatus Levybacteria bacterium RIFCSPHIGHO2_01_FULL_36_15b]OGH34345.1 MAG: hypothetical protein A3B38_04285 [Candidatus Levybacteria bacterium RIFCSPLOWO2_01_FULL_36_13]
MKSLKQTYIINAPVKEVWKALTDPKYIEGWGAGKCVMDEKEGTNFSLWGESIWGRNTKVVSGKLLIQDWYSDETPKWKSPSIVTFELVEENGNTKLDLTQENIPEKDFQNIFDGWKDYYVGPLKAFVESKN